ncbi:MAG: HAD family hydrolase [Chloroflexi bacterium]|nr:HAD family hydrolase [Chloroflexota bacterium]
MRPTPRAVFFDLDGTLLDNGDYSADWLVTCEAFALRQGLPDARRLHEAIDERRAWFWRDPVRDREGRLDIHAASIRIVTEALAKLGVGDAGIARTIAEDYRERRDAALRLFDGAVEVVERARAMGAKTALLTNGAAGMQREKVVRFGLAPYFDCIVIEGEFGCGKPDERVFRHALQSVVCDAGQAWMVGDNLVADISTACELGMHTVWVDASDGGLPKDAPAQPHRTIRHIRELHDSVAGPRRA